MCSGVSTQWEKLKEWKQAVLLKNVRHENNEKNTVETYIYFAVAWSFAIACRYRLLCIYFSTSNSASNCCYCFVNWCTVYIYIGCNIIRTTDSQFKIIICRGMILIHVLNYFFCVFLVCVCARGRFFYFSVGWNLI